MPVHLRRRTRRAFSLIEIIVVITVLGVLAAILVPVIASARASARSTHCVSNLQQLGRAFAVYAQEHNNCLPAPVDPAGTGTPWYAAIHPYAGRPWTGDMTRLAPVFSCPTWQALDTNVPAVDNIGYSMSAQLGSVPSLTRPVPIASIAQPSRTVLLLEMSGPESIVFPTTAAPGPAFAAWYTSTHGAQGCERHDGSANYLFVDGHVGHLSPTSARTVLE